MALQEMDKNRLALIQTFGCQMNERDTETIMGLLAEQGYGFTNEPEEADLILYNTCCVRENPERKVYGQVGLLKALKDEKPELVIGICGCMPQQREELNVMIQRLPHVDLFFGTHNIHRLPELLHKVEVTGEQVVEVWDENDEPLEGLPALRQSSLKAWITIMHGCNNFCTYCIVPYVRGKEHSRTPKAIIEEAQRLAADGIKEVTLLGQNVNSYGQDLGGELDFAKLLAEVNKVEGLERIRFTTSHPKDVSDELIKALADYDKVCEHLHLPVQAGSSKVLKRMNRGYDREYYLRLVDKIRKAVPNISLTTDIMVGFPGETEADFLDTMALVREVEYDAAFTFIYSKRKGTPATRMADHISEEVKKDRIYRLIELQNAISLKGNQALVGSTEEVLLESVSKGNPEMLTGKTRTAKNVLVKGDKNLIGQLVPVTIDEAGTWSLTGTVSS